MADDTQTIIAKLAAAFPTAKIGREHVAMYVKALRDIPVDELQQAAEAHAIDSQWFPSIRELRRTVMAHRSGLPSMEEAWEQANLYAEQTFSTPRTIRCPNSECVAGVVPSEGEAPKVDRSLLDGITNPAFRAQLERIANAMEAPTAICPTCDGEGEISNPQRAAIEKPHWAVALCLEHVGGPHGVVTTDVPEVLRSQFLKAYGRIRDQAVRAASLESAGLGELTGSMRPELPRGDG